MHDATASQRFQAIFQLPHQDIIQFSRLTRSERVFTFICPSHTGSISGSHIGSCNTANVIIVPMILRDLGKDNTILNGGFPLVAVETRFPQTYENLLLNMRKWLEDSLIKPHAKIPVH